MRLNKTIAATCILSLTLLGCDKSEDGGAASLDSVMSGAKDAVDGAVKKAAAGFEKQLEKHESSIASLKAKAKEHSDGKLDGIIDQLDGKLADAKKKIKELAGAEGGAVAAVKSEVTAMLSDIPKLMEKAKARLEELKG